MIRAWILRRLREPTTWAGLLTLVCSAAGFTLTPEQQQAIVGVFVAIVGAVLVVFPERSSSAVQPDKPQTQPLPATPLQPDERHVAPADPRGQLWRGPDGILRRIPNPTPGPEPTGREQQ